MQTIINGRIFEFPRTGVGRFCYEVVSEMDNLVKPGEMILAIPKDAKNVPKLRNIAVKTIGKGTGILWEQVELPLYVKKKRGGCLSMSSSVPLLSHEYVLIHDIALKVNSRKNGTIKDKLKIWWPLLQYYIGIKKSRVIMTLSEYQKKEMMREYRISKNIPVVYAGWQHMNRVTEDDSIIEKYNLRGRAYLYAVATKAKNKNFKWILKVAQNNPDKLFVVSGKLDTKYFADETNLDEVDNIISTGYVTDNEIKSLMKHATAFIFPSTYEGFGIPPLEALSVGTRVIVGQASCLPEIYGDYALYIDPNNYDVDFDQLLTCSTREPQDLLNTYSWEKTTKIIMNHIMNQHHEHE